MLSTYIFSTKLPLRYVYLAVDDNDSRQDPRDVTQKWEEEQGLGMTFWVVNVSEFASSTSSPNQSYTNSSNSTTTTSKEEAHHDFIHRQRAFITECTRFLQQQGVHWTTYIDTDEFIVINHLGHEDYNDDNNNTRKGPSFQPSREEFRAARRDLPPMETQPTVLQVLKNSTITTITTTQYPACTSMPRLLYGALETTTCLEAQETLDFAQAHFPRRYSDLSTLRFEQHARKGDFQKSRWGKVLMNVSGVPQDILNDNNSHSPRNIHRPWKEVCGPAAVHFPDAIFYVNHYIGSWERYNSRSYDARRNRDEWEQRAYLSDGRSCDKRIHEWLPEFVEQVGGLDTAKRLLGQ